jgi:hypothetical protein
MIGYGAGTKKLFDAESAAVFIGEDAPEQPLIAHQNLSRVVAS